MSDSNWLLRDKASVWHPFTQLQTAPDPLHVVKAKDCWLFTSDGKKYLDANSSWWVNIHGHGNEDLAQALQRQFLEVDHIIFAGATHSAGIELSEKVLKLLPTNFSKVFFSDDGSTSVEVALKMVMQFFYNRGDERKRRIIALDGAYHGDTFGAMAVGQRGYFNLPFESYFFDVDFIDFPDEESVEQVIQKYEALLSSGEIACIILEPLVQGSAGMRMYSADTLDRLTKLAHDYGAMVIFDEIMTGWGRTGKMFAMDHVQHKPDIVCLSKGLTGGVLPLGLTVATQEIFDAFLSEDKLRAFLHGHSFTGNPLACAVACESIDLFERNQVQSKIHQIKEWNQDLLQRWKDHPMVAAIRCQGTILALEVSTGEGNTYFSNIRDWMYDFYIDRGILLRPLGNVIFFNAPYCITREEYELLISATEDLLTEMLKRHNI